LECNVVLNFSLKFVFLAVILLTFYQHVKKGEVMISIFLQLLYFFGYICSGWLV